MPKRSSLIKLADNPEFDSFYSDEGDEGFGDEGGAEEDLGDDTEFKGRNIKGPRQIINGDGGDIDELMKSMKALAKAVSYVAQVQKAQLDKEWANDGVSPEDPDVEENEDSNLDMAEVGQAADGSTVRKDDATGASFGSKDSTEPGNRPYDQNGTGEEDTLINGPAGAGPGPVSKARTSGEAVSPTMLRRAIREELQAAGLTNINKSRSPGVGSGSRVDKAVTYDEAALRKQAKGASFQDLARLRVQLGDISAGVL